MLGLNKDRWAQTTTAQRVGILGEIKDRLLGVADEWAQIASRNKQIPDGSPLEGEEWVSGPYAVMAACNALMVTLLLVQIVGIFGALACFALFICICLWILSSSMKSIGTMLPRPEIC